MYIYILCIIYILYNYIVLRYSFVKALPAERHRQAEMVPVGYRQSHSPRRPRGHRNHGLFRRTSSMDSGWILVISGRSKWNKYMGL